MKLWEKLSVPRLSPIRVRKSGTESFDTYTVHDDWLVQNGTSFHYVTLRLLLSDPEYIEVKDVSEITEAIQKKGELIDSVAQKVQLTLFISGPMSGLPGYNRNAFYAAEIFLKKQGYPFVYRNPASLPDGKEYREYINICLEWLSQSDMIYMLKGWQLSKGSLLEHQYARNVGLIVAYEEGAENECYQVH